MSPMGDGLPQVTLYRLRVRAEKAEADRDRYRDALRELVGVLSLQGLSKQSCGRKRATEAYVKALELLKESNNESQPT